MNLLCRLGYHNWSANRNGVQICLRCPAVNRFYGLTGLLRSRQEEKEKGIKDTDAELREWWLKEDQRSTDIRYMTMASKASTKSTCAKKQLGCVLVLAKDENVVLSGSNGPPQGMKKCERKTIPLTLKKYVRTGPTLNDPTGNSLTLIEKKHGRIPVEGCPRLESHNGTDLDKCRAVHAERQVLLKAAYSGYSTAGSTLYSYMGVPCKDCLLEIWEAGVAEIVVLKETYYDELSKEILKEWMDAGRKFRVMEG